jgi:hypothetical protein
MSGKQRFAAILGGEKGERPHVELPFDVRATFGAARPKVKVTVNGIELRTTVAVYAGKSFVGFRKDIRDAAGIAIGDRIDVVVEADEVPREVAVPKDLARALAKDKAAKASFEAMAFTHRKEFAAWIEGAKKSETRDRRVAKAIEMIREKKTR